MFNRRANVVAFGPNTFISTLHSNCNERIWH